MRLGKKLRAKGKHMKTGTVKAALETAAKTKIAKDSKKSSKEAVNEVFHEPRIGEYNDKPLFIVNGEKEQYAFQFGLGKAKMLIQPQVLAALKAFVESNGESID